MCSTAIILSIIFTLTLNSFMTNVPIMWNPDLQSKSMDWFLYDRELRHERVGTG